MTIRTKWEEKDSGVGSQFYLCSFEGCNNQVIKILSDGYHATSDEILDKKADLFCSGHAKMIQELLQNK